MTRQGLRDASDPLVTVDPAVDARTGLLPPYRVLLHNDDVNTFDHVIKTILRLTPLKLAEAVQRTMEAHEKGISLLLTTHRERAELYVEQFATFSICVTMEPG